MIEARGASWKERGLLLRLDASRRHGASWKERGLATEAGCLERGRALLRRRTCTEANAWQCLSCVCGLVRVDARWARPTCARVRETRLVAHWSVETHSFRLVWFGRFGVWSR